MKFVLLAAGKSKRIYNKINKNKCLIKIKRKTIIENSVDEILKTRIKDIVVVVGFRPEPIKKKLKNYKNINFILNSKYNSREMLYSLILALRKCDTDIIFGYTDIIFSYKTINKIIKSSRENITIPILSNWKKIWKIRNKNPYDDAETLFVNKTMHYQFMG